MVDVTAPNLTGINRWWSYEEGPLPGVGRYMINVWQENLILQADDMDIHYRGIDLAFRRTYNSYSTHDYAGTDGSVVIGQYGTGWTNTFDAHIAQNTAGGMTIYDIDGARYDYGYDPSGNLVPPAGMEGTSLVNGGGALYWTKKSGTQYTFYAPYYSGSMAAYSGRIYRIAGRNRHNYIQFSYAWDNGDATVSSHMSAMYATTDSGKQAVLAFADFNGQRLLSSLTFPDNVTSLVYGYDPSGNLTVVRKPGSASQYVWETYGGYKGSQIYVAGPRWNDASDTAPGYTIFNLVPGSYNTGQINYVVAAGVVNFQPADGTPNILQPGTAAGVVGYRYSSLGVGQPDYTTMWDTDGHVYEQVHDALGRPTIRYAWSGSQWLATVEQWDAHNNRIADVDMRGNETDYAYDANGNTIAVAEPQTVTSQGTFRPTRLYDYDTYNNVVAHCDQSQTHQAGADWTAAPAPSDSLCASRAAGVPHATFTYAYPDYEPSGELTAMTTPSGYTRRFAYAPLQQGGADYGLPTSVVGDPISQNDPTTPIRQPQQSFWYDFDGYLRCYSKGLGTAVISHDILGRMTSMADPDDSSANGTSLCGKSSGQPGWNTQTTYTYNVDGTVQSSQTPSERARGVATTFAYDADKNTTSETHHYGWHVTQASPAAVTRKWYDGADRLVEVALPRDLNDSFYPGPWLTRYIYDLAQGQNVSFRGASFAAHGHLYKTQEWVVAPGASSSSWLDLKATAFDPLDRPVANHSIVPGSNGTLATANLAYDATPSSLGLLSSKTDELGEIARFNYDPRGNTTSVTYENDGGITPPKASVYDPNGRITSVGNTFGSMTYRYDQDGRIAEVDEPSNATIVSPARIGYDYHADGSRKDVTVSSSLLNQNPLLQYAYRQDGLPSRISMNYGSATYGFTSTYTDGGRMLSRTDPFTGTAIPYPRAPVVPGSVYAATSWSYDGSGQVMAKTMPFAYAYTSIIHDNEGNLASWHANSSANGDVMTTYENTVRGENLGTTTSAAGGSVASTAHTIANGAVLPVVGGAMTVDPYNALFIGYSETAYDAGLDGFAPQPCPQPNSVTQQFDAARRLQTRSSFQNGPNCDGNLAQGDVETWTYDAENHTVHSGGGDTLSWGPDGHAHTAGAGGMHYDGDAILFTTYNGALQDIKIPGLGFLGIAQSTPVFVVTDRDPTEHEVTHHTSGRYDAVSFTPAGWRRFCAERLAEHGGGSCTTNAVPATSIYASANQNVNELGGGGLFPYKQPDGFDIAGMTIQGVRASDHGSGTWTTPDAYAGDVHDPMSQKSFMWNRNDPYEYQDPTGFFWESITGIPAEALYIAFQSPTFVEAWQAIADSPRAFTLTGNNGEVFRTQPKDTVGVTFSEFGVDFEGTLQVSRSDAYIKPGLSVQQAASTIMHEVGGHQYYAIKDPKRESEKKAGGFKEDRAYARERLMDTEAMNMHAFNELRGIKNHEAGPDPKPKQGT